MADPDLLKFCGIIFSHDFWNGLFQEAFSLVSPAFTQAFKDVWDGYKIWILFLFLLFFAFKYWEKGIGSVLYNAMYLNIWAIIIFVFGWQILFSDWIKIIMFLTYVIIFRLTKYFLIKFGVWSH